jgi:DNA polymerase-3 subunit epsilon
MIKTLYIDTETTGTDPGKHALIELAAIVDIDGEAVDEASWYIHPFENDFYTEKALEITGITKEQMLAFPPGNEVKPQIEAFLQKHVDKYDRHDKFYVAGQNVGFDIDFLAAFWRKMGDVYLGSYINWRKIDLLSWVDQLCWLGIIELNDRKLQTICNLLGVELGESAHEALADIRATRQCIIKLKEIIIASDLKAKIRAGLGLITGESIPGPLCKSGCMAYCTMEKEKLEAINNETKNESTNSGSGLGSVVDEDITGTTS